MDRKTIESHKGDSHTIGLVRVRGGVRMWLLQDSCSVSELIKNTTVYLSHSIQGITSSHGGSWSWVSSMCRFYLTES